MPCSRTVRRLEDGTLQINLNSLHNTDISALRGLRSANSIHGMTRRSRSPKLKAVDDPTPMHYFWQKYGALMRRRAAGDFNRTGQPLRMVQVTVSEET